MANWQTHDTAMKNVKLNDEPKDAEDNFKESRKDICT